MTNDGVNPQPAARRQGVMVPFLIVGVFMAGEGVAVYLLANALSPAPASALAGVDDGNGSEPGRSDEYAEIELAECWPSNLRAGRFVTFHVRVSALVDQEDRKSAEQLVRSKRARLEDAVNTVIRSAEPKELNEPELGTLKRRLKYEFGLVFGDDELIKEVLIPQWLQSSRGV